VKAAAPTLLTAFLVTLCACGESSGANSLNGYVREAMAGLPYEYRMIPELRTEHYVVFKMVNPRKEVDVNVAFGLPSRKNTCAKPPNLPARHRKGFRPFFGAAGAPIICLATDSWRPFDSREEGAIRTRMALLVPSALCNAVYDKEEFEDFVCFD
jgi:hypothetical protein